MSAERCPGCGLELTPVATPTHAYIGASPSCWALFGELLARDYTDWEPASHRLAVDAYAVQHPGGDERRARQSVAYHLASLHLALERGFPHDEIAGFLRRASASRAELPKLEPPRPNGTITVRDVLAGTGVEEWARDVWAAWAPHHERARAWAGSDG